MSHFEPETRDFLQRIVLSLFLGFAWLVVNMTIGIYFGLFFIWDRLSAGNLFCYIFLVLSLAFLVRFLWKTWKKRFPHG